jgi:calcineurin-like phosphoesterase family protein
MLWRWFDNLLFTHVPTHPSTLTEARGGHPHAINVHGHTHTTGSPKGPYTSVCVELINYTPIHIEELKEKAGKLYNV